MRRRPFELVRYNRNAMDEKLEGSFSFMFAFDVGEEIRLEAVPAPGDSGATRRAADLRRPTPVYVRFEQPPVLEPLAPILLEGGERLRGELKLYDYGVISARLDLPFQLNWTQLVERSSRLLEDPEPRARAAAAVKACLERIGPAIVKPHQKWLEEEYYVVQVSSPGHSARSLMETAGGDIARIVRGEARELSDAERDEVLRSRLSYHPDDLMVVGWAAAFIYDTAEGASADLQLLEYANTQLLEFRYYDHVLTTVLQDVYRYLERRRGPRAGWRMAREARRLNTILLDVRELTERADTSIKFLSDMFSARVYRLAAERIGVADYRRLVEGKVQTASQLYRFMMDQFDVSRAFVLELMIVIILIIDLFFLFRGKPGG
jgi:hypothetical protein